AVQPDGGILAGGSLILAGDGAPRNLVRFGADGSIDTKFAPQINNAVRSITLQPGGGILICGDFDRVGSSPANRIARLGASGTLEAFPAEIGADRYSI